MAKQYFDFVVRDLIPRPFWGLAASGSFLAMPFGVPAWAWNRFWAKPQFTLNIALCLLVGFVVYLLFYSLAYALFGLSAECPEPGLAGAEGAALHQYGNYAVNICDVPEKTFCGFVSAALNGAGRVLIDVIRGFLLGGPGWTALATFLLVRLGQHAFDWRDWHVPWSDAHFNRFYWWPFSKYSGAQDFPVLIVGRGGSGKSTLARMLEHDFLRRQIFRPSGFRDEGGDESLVVRSGSGEVGESVRPYEITWRPDLYKVGRLAEAYDLPGQVLEDWKEAIREMKDCRRVLIINVLTNGYSSSIAKFDTLPSGDTNVGDFKKLVECGTVVVRSKTEPKNSEDGLKENPPQPTSGSRTSNEKWKEPPTDAGLELDPDYFEEYRSHILGLEKAGFEVLVKTILECWPKKKSSPQLLVLHVIGKADLWVNCSADLTSGIQNSRVVKKKYEDEFMLLHKDLTDHLKGRFTYKFLPASLQFGVVPHDRNKEFKIFDSEKEIVDLGLSYEDTRSRIIEKQASLGRSTVKTLRTIRKEFYRRHAGYDWKGQRIGHPYGEFPNANIVSNCPTTARKQDLYDDWEKA